MCPANQPPLLAVTNNRITSGNMNRTHLDNPWNSMKQHETAVRKHVNNSNQDWYRVTMLQRQSTLYKRHVFWIVLKAILSISSNSMTLLIYDVLKNTSPFKTHFEEFPFNQWHQAFKKQEMDRNGPVHHRASLHIIAPWARIQTKQKSKLKSSMSKPIQSSLAFREGGARSSTICIISSSTPNSV